MIYARLLVMTRSIQLAAVQAALAQRTVIRLNDADWRELTEDPNFRFSHDAREWTTMNDVLITHHRTKAPETVVRVETPRPAENTDAASRMMEDAISRAAASVNDRATSS